MVLLIFLRLFWNEFTRLFSNEREMNILEQRMTCLADSKTGLGAGGGGGGISYLREGDARRKFGINQSSKKALSGSARQVDFLLCK